MLVVVDLGVDFGDQAGTEHAAQDAARAGSVAELGQRASCALTPAPDPSSDGALARRTRRLICLAKALTNRRPDDVRVKVAYVADDSTIASAEQPVGPGQPGTASIVVCVQARAGSVSGLLGSLFDGDVHEARAIVRTGAPTGGRYAPPGGELPLPGHDWDFCATDRPDAPAA